MKNEEVLWWSVRTDKSVQRDFFVNAQCKNETFVSKDYIKKEKPKIRYDISGRT